MPRAQNIAEDGTSFRNAQRRLGLRLRHASSDRAAADRPPCPQRRAPPSRCPCGVGRERAVPALLQRQPPPALPAAHSAHPAGSSAAPASDRVPMRAPRALLRLRAAPPHARPLPALSHAAGSAHGALAAGEPLRLRSASTPAPSSSITPSTRRSRGAHDSAAARRSGVCVGVCVLHSFQTAKTEARGPQRADRPAHSTPSGLETCRVASSHRPTSLGQTWGGPGTRWDKTTETRRGGDPPGASPSLSRGKTHVPSRGCFKTTWSQATVATA